MAVYERPDSPFWWIWIESTDARQSTKIPIGSGTAKTRSRKDAEEVYRAAMGDVARGVYKLRTRKGQRTFRQHATWYQQDVTVTHRARGREHYVIANLIAYFGDAPLSTIVAAQIEAWKLARAKQVKQSTVNRELAILRAILRSAVPQYLDSNPTAGVKKFRERCPPITILSPDAERAILAVASPAETAMVLLGLDALLRLGDVRRLKVEHDRGTWLEIVDPKVQAYKVPVSTRLRKALDALEPKGGFYFPIKHTEWCPIGPVTAHKIFRALCIRADVRQGRKAGGVTFHSLRHTGATRAARNVKLTVVQRLGGWKNLTQLARYDHPEDAEIVYAAESIAREPDVNETNRNERTGDTRKRSGRVGKPRLTTHRKAG